MKSCLAVLAAAMLCAQALAQHEHMAMHHGSAARLEARDDRAAQVLTVRLGPVNLPAHASHMGVAQPPTLFLDIPFEGWITAYHPRLVDSSGNPVPGRLLHHVAFYNTARPDFLCPNKQEHIFGAGGEMNDWPTTPGFGYRVHKGDRIRVGSMFHNPTDTNYPETFLQVQIEYRPASDATPLKSVYPTWFDVKECGRSDYDLSPGQNVARGKMTVGYSGILLGVGGHMHDYGRQLVLENSTRQDNVAILDSKLDESGHIVSMPIVLFLQRGGYHLNRGDQLNITATYQNPTRKVLKDGAMGIVVGYFLPDKDQELSQLHH